MISYMKDVLASGIFNSSTDKHKELNILFRNLRNICSDTILRNLFILNSMSLTGFKWYRLGLNVGDYHFSVFCKKFWIEFVYKKAAATW